jgi:hypothetical protein
MKRTWIVEEAACHAKAAPTARLTKIARVASVAIVTIAPWYLKALAQTASRTAMKLT